MLQVEAFSLSLTEKIKEQNKSTKETRVPYLPSRKLGDIEAATQIMVDEGDSLVTDFMSSGGVWGVGCVGAHTLWYPGRKILACKWIAAST